MRSKLLCGVSALMLFAPTSAWGAVTEQAGPGSQTKLASPGVGDAASPQTQADSAQQSEIDAGQLKDIVVTAERRTENLQKVPIAATSMSSDDLQNKSVNRIDDLQLASPSLSVTDAGLTQSVNIRGIGISSGSPAVANGVAVYINGVFQPPLLTTSSFYDIGDVEVLRGPQGTLVGSNSTGGAIFINTQKPLFDRFGGYLQGGIGNYAAKNLEGAINLPLASDLALRVAGTYQKRNSYFDDIGLYNNHPDSLDEKAGRVSLRWEPGRFSVNGHLEWIDKNSGGYAYQPVAGTPYSAGRVDGPRTLDYDAPTRNYERGFLSDLEMKYEFGGGVTLRYQSGYTNKRVNNLYDSDGTSLNTAALPAATQDQFVQEQEWTQEVNLISPTTGRFNWILGGYYQHNKINVDILQHTGAPVDPTHILIHDYKTTVGAFVQGGYKLSDQLELDIGGRYSHYAVTQTGSVAIGYGTIFGPDGLTVADLGNDHKDGRFTGKVSLNYQPDKDNLIYAFVARGYKPGGANSATSEFKPETVWDYELGWKSTMLDNHLRTQIGGFYMDYSNFQFDYVDTTTGQSGVANVANSRIYGAEVQIQARFGNLGLDGGFAYVHSRLGSLVAVNERLVPPGVTLGPECGATPTTGCTDYGPYLQDAGGGPNLLSPKWTFNVGADYEIKLGGDLTLTPRVNYAYVGEQYATYFYSPQYDLLRSRGLLSAQLTLQTGGWSIEGYTTNLTNKTYVSGISGNNEFYGAPREYGVRAKVRF